MASSQAKLAVDFRPIKRIKKRRELDALVCTKHRFLTRSGTKSGRNELLRSESDSSEMEEFDGSAKVLLPKKGRSCTCSTCFGVLYGVLLAACLVSICGLIATFVQLRKEVTELQSRLAKVDESSSDFSSRLQDVRSVQRDFGLRLQRFDVSVNDIQRNISTIVSQVDTLDGSLKALDLDLSHWQNANSPAPSEPNNAITEKTGHPTRNQLSEDDDEVLLELLAPKFSWVEKKLNRLNVSTQRSLEEMKTHSTLVDVSMSALTNYTLLLNDRIRFLELLSGGTRAPSSDELYRLVNRVLQSQIGMLNTSIDAISDKLDVVLASIERFHNSTNSNIRSLNLTTDELSSRLKLVEATVHLMLSDSVVSEATPDGRVNKGPTQSSATRALPATSSSTDRSQMKMGRSTAVLNSLPRS